VKLKLYALCNYFKLYEQAKVACTGTCCRDLCHS